MNKILNIPAIISKVTTLVDNSIRVYVDLNELPSIKLAELFEFRNKSGIFSFAESNIDETDIEPPVLPQVEKKTQSQRLRAAIYRYWETLPKDKYPNYEDFYRMQMEVHIKQYTSKLD